VQHRHNHFIHTKIFINSGVTVCINNFFFIKIIIYDVAKFLNCFVQITELFYFSKIKFVLSKGSEIILNKLFIYHRKFKNK